MPFDPNNWNNASSVAFHGRSPEFQQIGTALQQYQLAKSGMTLKALARAILAWQAQKAPWTASIRRAAVVELINYVKTEAKVRLAEADEEIFSYVKCEPVVNLLINDPRRVLAHRPLYVAGEPDGVAQFRVSWSESDPTYGYGLLIPNPIMFPTQEKYSVAATNRGPVWQAVSIAMHTDVSNATPAATVEGKLYRLAGSSSMTTGQLSGCTFIIRQRDGHLECTHLKPNHFADGVALQNYVEGLYLGDNVKIYGRKDYPDVGGAEVRVAIVGRRGPHGWEVFAQRYFHGTSNVQGIDRIWPPLHG